MTHWLIGLAWFVGGWVAAWLWGWFLLRLADRLQRRYPGKH